MGQPHAHFGDARQHVTTSPLSFLFLLIFEQGLKGSPGQPGPRGKPGPPVSKATNVPWGPKVVAGAMGMGRAGAVGGAARVAGACHVTGVIVTQGLAGPPGPSGPALTLSKEELRVSGAAWGLGLLPLVPAACWGQRDSDAVLCPIAALCAKSRARRWVNPSRTRPGSVLAHPTPPLALGRAPGQNARWGQQELGSLPVISSTSFTPPTA